MLVLAAIFVGIYAYENMRVELNPDVSFGVISITTNYTGAGPEVINEQISRKVEEAVSGVNGLREVTSTSREGVSAVVASFNIGIDQNQALDDVRSKVDAITSELPKDADKSARSTRPHSRSCIWPFRAIA
jgi:HAE1 family hydrophobic/amphiphilic exporter-1